ncbi:MAG: redoxin domain-containing protein [Bacteroidetes bacterium]|nr:redoxin domain-containing protein [Bacteroidota bacterium]
MNKIILTPLKQSPGKTLILLFLLFTAFGQANASGYQINVLLQNSTDTILFLNHYSGKEILTDDTARKINNGPFLFSGSDSLDNGYYFISSKSRKKLFDFFITGSQNLSFEVNIEDPFSSMVTGGSVDNSKYYNALKILRSSFGKQVRVPDSLPWLMANVDYSLSSVFKLFNDKGSMSICEKYLLASIPTGIYQKYFVGGDKAGKDAAIQFIDHFFDNLDLNEEFLISTPVYEQRIDEFIDTVSMLPTLNMQKQVDRLISLAGNNAKAQSALVWHLESHFGAYYFLPGFDEMYVHIINDFLENGKVAWYFPVVRDRELTQLKKISLLLNGNTGPDMEMPDTSGIMHSLYSQQSNYTLLLFWASTCSHCRDEMPSITRFYADFHSKYNLEIFGVSTDTSVTRWKNYIRKHQLPWVNVFGRKSIRGNYHLLYNVQSTPVMFLMDDKKKILAKYLTPEKFAAIIKQRESANPNK